MPFGAEPGTDGVRFRLWAPDAREVTLCLEGPGPRRELGMKEAGSGFFELHVPGVRGGARYRFRIDGDALVSDPASRFQPEGVHGPSEVVDPVGFAWSDAAWRGRPWEEAVLYELHVGAATPGGRYADLLPELDDLAALGVTAVELMPLAECPGARNWGYDGTHPFAPESAYGRPEDLKRLIEAAHARGLMVFLDVVYNHFGPEGNELGRYASPFFTQRHATPWGDAIDFGQRAVRDFFVHNALFWILEYHVDGLRLDAVHAIRDDSRPDVLEELVGRVRAGVPPGRHVHLVLENDANEARRLARAPDGSPCLYTAQWNDDLHHALHVLVTGEREGYYADYADAPLRRLGRALAEGFVYQGEPSRHRGGAPRGEPSAGLPPTAFVHFLQNHDQIGNRALGERLTRLALPEALRAATAVLLLAPGIPLLFMGEEWGADEPFPFFCDFGPELAAAVREGRRREFAAFPAFRAPDARRRIPDPGDPETFRMGVLDRRRAAVTRGAAERLEWTRTLLAVRRREIVPRLRGTPGGSGVFEELPGGALRVGWTLGDGAQLGLLARLAPQPWRGTPISLPGRTLCETPSGAAAAAAEGRLPPWSVLFALLPGSGA
jgi:malto-oligosyltrehalose trehalohydrolase